MSAGESPELIFQALDSDGNGSLSLSELHCKLSDFGLGEEEIERVFFALDTDGDGEVSQAEFVAGFGKYQYVVKGGHAEAFRSGPCKQWGYQKWEHDRWLDFDGHTVSVYKCSGAPQPGAAPLFTVPMDISTCFMDPSSKSRFAIDTGAAIVHFKAENAKTCQAWVGAFSAAQVPTTQARVDLIKAQKKFKTRIPSTSGDYYLGEVIGSGGFASVKTGIHGETGLRVAVKIMPAASAAEPEHKKEIVHMAALKHPNIVEVKDVVYVQERQEIYIMLELMSGGELFTTVVEQEEGHLDEEAARYYFRQILEGIMYCHSRQLCHRDMKLENLLLDKTGKNVKITDFGFAKNLAEDGSASTVLGTAVYVAPEVLDGLKYDGYKVDMWACGVVLYAMCAACSQSVAISPPAISPPATCLPACLPACLPVGAACWRCLLALPVGAACACCPGPWLTERG
jgi:hypothetical protein